MSPPDCPTCTRPMEPYGAGRTVEHGTVRATVDGPAGWSCVAGHAPVLADPAAARREVHDLIDVAERTAIRNTLRCGVCHTPYRMPGRRVTRSLTLTTTGLPVTRITLDVPMLRCTEDAVEGLPPECLTDLDTVVDDLFGGPA